MPQVIELPNMVQETRNAILTLARVCKETPAKGESFREFRSRLRGAKLWDRERPHLILRFLGTSGATVMPSLFMQTMAAAPSDEAALEAMMDRLWHLNPVLGKLIVDLVTQRAFHKDEIYKQVVGSGFRGKIPSRPMLEVWLQIAIATGFLKTIGISVALGPTAERWVALAANIDVEEYVAEDKPEPEPVIPNLLDDDAAAPVAAVAAAEPTRETSIPVQAAAPTGGSSLPAPLRHLTTDGVPTPRNREKPVAVSRFAGGFSDDVKDETRTRIASWWADVSKASLSYQPSDFGIESEAWVEGADEVVYRIAVAAALAFRLDRDRNSVIASFQALDKVGVLGDLYQGIVPENLPAHVDARALMLASLAARRCAEVPELASQLEGRASAAEAFAALDGALGRGLFRTELFWMVDMLAKLGVIRYDDLGDFTTTPHRIVRDTLFRLGFIESPYANDAAALATAARAARKAVPDGAADEILTMFALAAGCAYDCTHRKSCDFPCRERLE